MNQDIHIYLPDELAERLRAAAKENGLSLTAQARMILMAWLRESKKEEAA